MISSQSSVQASSQEASGNASSVRSPARSSVSLAQNVFGSLHIVRQLFAYYANWRSASRVLDEGLDSTIDRAAHLSEKSAETLK